MRSTQGIVTLLLALTSACHAVGAHSDLNDTESQCAEATRGHHVLLQRSAIMSKEGRVKPVRKPAVRRQAVRRPVRNSASRPVRQTKPKPQPARRTVPNGKGKAKPQAKPKPQPVRQPVPQAKPKPESVEDMMKRLKRDEMAGLADLKSFHLLGPNGKCYIIDKSEGAQIMKQREVSKDCDVFQEASPTAEGVNLRWTRVSKKTGKITGEFCTTLPGPTGPHKSQILGGLLLKECSMVAKGQMFLAAKWKYQKAKGQYCRSAGLNDDVTSDCLEKAEP